MSMRNFGKKALAIIMATAILTSCMIFSFSASAEATKMWWNDFEGNGTATFPYGSATANDGWNSGRSNTGHGNYAVLERGANGNDYMALGFSNSNSWRSASGFKMLHSNVTVKGATGAGSSAGYTTNGGANYAFGYFKPQTGKYAVKLKYRLESINAGASGVDICMTVGTLNWNQDVAIMGTGGSQLSTSRFPTTVIATATAADEGAGWRTATALVEVDNAAGAELQIFAKRHSANSESLTGTEVWVDDIEIYKYEQDSDVSTVTFYQNGVEVGKVIDIPGAPFTMPALDGISANAELTFYSDEACTTERELPTVYPATSLNIYVRTKEPVMLMWENHFNNGTDSNWKSKYSDSVNASNSNVGNLCVVQTDANDSTNSYMSLKWTADGAEDRQTGFLFFHEQATHNNPAQRYGYDGAYKYTISHPQGMFRPENTNYAIKLDYKLANIREGSAHGINIKVGAGGLFNASAPGTTDGSGLTEHFLNNSGAQTVVLVDTVYAEDVEKGWQTAVVYLEFENKTSYDPSMYLYAGMTGNTKGTLEDAELLIDNVEIWEYKQESDLPTVSFYYEGVKVGSSSGLAGSAFRKPTLAVDVPSGGRLAYYEDEACTRRIDMPTVYAATSQKIYIDVEQILLPLDTVMWENSFNNGSTTNWLSCYGAINTNGAYNSGQSNTDNQNYAVHKKSGSNGYMALGFGNSSAGNYLSGFIMTHQDTTHNDFTRAGYYGNYTGTDYAKGNFFAPLGSYKVSLKYKLANMPNTSNEKFDLYVAFGEEDMYWNGARQMSRFENYQKIATISSADLNKDWKEVTAYIENTTGYAMHFFIARSTDSTASLAGTEVWLDDIQVSPSSYTSVLFYYEGNIIARTPSEAPGTAFTAPKLTLPVDVPDGYKIAYYRDITCVDEIDLPTVYPNATLKVHVKVVKAVEETWSFEKEANNTRLDINTSATTTIYTDNIIVARSGNASARVNADAAGNSANLYPQMLIKNGSDQFVSVDKGNNYELTFWVYQPAEHGTYPIKYWVAAINNDAPFNDTNLTRDNYVIGAGEYTPTATGVWEKVTVIINDCGSLGKVRLGLIGDQNSAHPFYIDDVTLTEMSLDKNAWTFDKLEAGEVLSINTSDPGRTATVDNFVKYSGYNSVRINGNTKLSDYFPQFMVKNDAGEQINVYEGRNYTISFRVYKPGSQPAYGINYWLTATTEDVDKEFNRVDPPAANSYRASAYRIGGGSNVSVMSGRWDIITLEIKNCAHTGKLRLGVSGDYNATHMFYIDDVSVEENFPVADIYVESFERYEENKVMSLNTDGASISVNTTDRHSGDFAAKVTSLGNSVASAPQMVVNDYHGTPFKVEKGKDYRIKFWVVRPSGQSDYDLTYWFAVTNSNAAFTTNVENAIVDPKTVVIDKAHTWQSIRVDIEDCPYSGTLRLGITGTTDEAHTFYIDDVAVTENTAGKPDPNAMNFEMYEVGENLALNQYLPSNNKYRVNSITISDEESYTGNQSAYFYSNTNMQNNRAHMLVRDGEGNIVTVKEGDDFFVSFMIYIPISEPFFTINYWLAATPAEYDTRSFDGQIANNPEFSVTKYYAYSSLSLNPPDYGVWTEIKMAVMDCPYSGNLRFGITHGNGGDFESHCYIDDIKKYDPEYVLIKFDTNGSEDKYEDILMMSDMLIPFVGNDPYRAGYEFMGWYTSKDFSKDSYIDITITPIVGKTGDVITLYARWREWTENVAEKGEKQDQYKTEYYTEKVWVGDQNVADPLDTGDRPTISGAEPITVTPAKPEPGTDGTLPPWLIVVIIVGAVVVVGGGAALAAILLKKSKKNEA